MGDEMVCSRQGIEARMLFAVVKAYRDDTPAA
jgi:hypothetical protein